MSKKSRRRNRQKRRQSASRPFPWLWLAGSVGALLIAGLLILQPWAGEDAPQTTPQTGAGPRLAVDQTMIDEGYVKYDVPIRTTFRLTNTGDQPLEILGEPQVRLAAGCWPPKAVVSSTTLQPGQEAQLTMDYTMHAGMDGPHEFHVYLRTNDPVAPETVLVARSDWGP